MFVFYKPIWRTTAYKLHSALSYHEGILAIYHIQLPKTPSMGDGCDRQQAGHHNNSSAILGTKDPRGETISSSTKTNKALKVPNRVSTKRSWIPSTKQARPTGCSLDPVWQKTRQSSLVKLVKEMEFLMIAWLFEETKGRRRLDIAGDKCANLSPSEKTVKQQL